MRFCARTLLVLFTILFISTPFVRADVRDRVNKFNGKYSGERDDKIDAIKALGTIDDPELLGLMARVFADEPNAPYDMDTVYRFAYEALLDAKGNDTVKAMGDYLERKRHWRVRQRFALAMGILKNPASLDQLLKALKSEREEKVQLAITEALMGFQKSDAYEQLYKLADKPPSPKVGIRAVLSLGWHDNSKTAKLLEKLMQNTRNQPVVRAEAMYRLSKRKSQRPAKLVDYALKDKETAMHIIACVVAAKHELKEFAPRIVNLLEKADTWQLQTAAARACGELKAVKSVELLINLWKKNPGEGIGQAIHSALLKITGKSFGPRWQYWYHWHKNLDKPLDGAAENEGEYVSYYGLNIMSKNICFVMDRSGSMREKAKRMSDYIGEGAVVKEQTRMGYLKAEMERCIKNLPEDCLFNMVAYHQDIDAWKKGQVRASGSNKASAIRWVNNQRGWGWTNIFDGLVTGWGEFFGSRGKPDYSSGPDTIVLLSDGRPSSGSYTRFSRFLWEIRRRNRHRMITIHCIGISDECEKLLKDIAEQNHGQYKLIAE
ncbi:MAG: HEAT repeat domain-containing protein [Planctomycetota bacterium]|nr:HEAT repeat domain-containing protein [Planctomycetota bacterium]